MSSILKALKKLEQETLENQAEPTPAMGLNIRPEQNRRKEKARRSTNKTTRWAWILCLALVFLGTATWVIFFPHGPGTVTPAPPQTAQTPKPAPLKTAAQPAPNIAVAIAELPKPSVPTTHAAPPQRPAPAPHSVPPQRPVPATHAAPPQRPGPTHPDTLPQLPGAVTPGAPSAPAPETQDTLPRPPDPQTRDTSPQPSDPAPQVAAGIEIPALADASLTINAISWSTVPERRLAVINSTLVREGQTVGEFRLVEIEEDQVIVQRAQKKWRVMFRLR